MKTGVVAVALAASTLLATPANAQDVRRGDRVVSSAQLQVVGQTNFRGNRGNATRHNRSRLNEFGQTPRQSQRLIDKAIYDCTCQLDLEARRSGYRGSDLVRPRVEQIGPKGFRVVGNAKLFDGYDYTRQRYDCVVRQGSVRRATDIQPVQYASHHSRRDRYGYGSTGLSISFGNRW